MTEHVILLSIPGLRPGDVGPSTPTLQKWADSGAAAPLTPTFPCVTSPVQAAIAAKSNSGSPRTPSSPASRSGTPCAASDRG
ncbi:MAG: alkaline phosphatase family protein [Planctomycetota bacterium]